MAAMTKENLLLIILAIPSMCTGLSYETLKGYSSGNVTASFSFSDKVFDQCANKCNEDRDCVGFIYTKSTPSPHVMNCNLTSFVHYPPSSSSDAHQRTAYMFPKSNCLMPVAYLEQSWRSPVSGFGYARDCYNAGYCWRDGCVDCLSCYTLDKPWLYNVARNKSAVQSSTDNLGANYGVDGNTDGAIGYGRDHIDTCTFTRVNDRHPWWRVDLGKTYEIHSIVLFNQRRWYRRYLQRFEIRVGFIDEAQGENPLCWKQDSPISLVSKTFMCQSGPRVGRYVSVEKNVTGVYGYPRILHLCEVVVIGALPRIENVPKVTHSTIDAMTVKWDKYQYASDDDISNYRLLATPKGTGRVDIVDVSKAFTEYTLTRLSRGTEYNISVIIIMADGTEGLPSPYILSRTVPCGCPPEDLKVKSRNSTSLLMEWKAPDNPKGIIINYKVGCTPGNDRSKVVQAEVKTHWMLGLQPQTEYSCYVKASTNKGFGEELRRTFKTLGAPREPQVKTTTENSITIKLHRIAGDESFTYLVLVKKHMKVNRATHEELKDIVTAPTYNQSSTNKQYRTAKLEGKDLDNPFTVGDGLIYGGIYNGPLTKGNIYSILYGALDKNGMIASDFCATSDPVKAAVPPTSANNWITPVIVVAVVLLVFLMIVIGIVSWKKRRETNEETVVKEEEISEHIYVNENINATQIVTHTKFQEEDASSTTPQSTIPINQATKVQKATTVLALFKSKKTSENSSAFEMKGMNVDRDCLEMIECIGTGCVADVWLAHLTVDPILKVDKTKVAVKMLREPVTRRQRRVFLDELKSVKAVPRHKNVIAFIGTCTKRDLLMVVMEFASGGNLKGYLRDPRTHANTSLPLTSGNLLTFARDVACGMEHLTKFEMIHPNLAARKVYLGENGICKVSDFSKADQIKENNVNLKKSLAPLPLRWMAIESIEKDDYTTMGNVWSFGVLLWEIITLAETPYQDMSEGDILSAIKSGYRLPKPPYCDQRLYTLMNSCWTVNPSERPTFLSLYQQLEGFLDGKAEYIRIDEINEHVYESLKK